MRIEKVVWEDSFGLSPGWIEHEDAHGCCPITITSVGRLVTEQDDHIVLAGSWGHAPEAQMGGVLAIPKSAIKRRRVVR